MLRGLPVYERLLASTPDHPRALANLGECLARENRLPRRVRLGQALALDPDHLIAQRNRPSVACRRQNDAAGREYAAVLARSPADPEALFGRGPRLLYSASRLALGYYRRAVAAHRAGRQHSRGSPAQGTTAVDSLRNPSEAWRSPAGRASDGRARCAGADALGGTRSYRAVPGRGVGGPIGRRGRQGRRAAGVRGGDRRAAGTLRPPATGDRDRAPAAEMSGTRTGRADDVRAT